MALIGYCGDDCEECPRYIATQTNDREALKAAAVLWHKVGLRDEVANPEEMICHGCAALDSCHYNDVRGCARERDVSNCGKCDVYPCDKLHLVFDKTHSYANKCRQTCDPQDYQILKRAFFEKKKRLDAIHRAHISN